MRAMVEIPDGYLRALGEESAQRGQYNYYETRYRTVDGIIQQMVDTGLKKVRRRHPVTLRPSRA